MALVSCGYNHTFVVLDNLTYITGNNEFGQLGERVSMSSYYNIYTSFGLTDLSNIRSVSCGENHTMLLTTDGTLYGIGNNAYGQLGIPNSGGQTYYDTIKHITVPTRPGTDIFSVSCGANHTMLLTSDGELYATGSNYYGQLGLPYKVNNNNYYSFQYIPTEPIKSVSCGRDHTMLLTSHGVIYATGKNYSGQLGKENPVWDTAQDAESYYYDGNYIFYYDYDDGSNYSEVKKSYYLFGEVVQAFFPDKISSVSCGADHTMFLKTDGNLYGTGANSSGQLGLQLNNDSPNYYLFQPINNVLSGTIRSVSCGERHTMFLTLDGKLYGTGANSSGQLGKLNEENSDYGFDSFVNITLPTDAKTILSVSCGANHTMLLTLNGLYATGNNFYGQLGRPMYDNTNSFGRCFTSGDGPTNVIATVQDYDNIAVSFQYPLNSGVPSVSNYYYKLNGDGDYIGIALNSNYFTISTSSLVKGANYSVTVYAYNLYWPTQYVNSSSVSVTPYKTGSAPFDVSAVPISGTSDILVTYKKPSDEGVPVANYYYKTDYNVEYSPILNNPTEFTISWSQRLLPGRDNIITVAAYNENWQTPYVDSSTVTVKTYNAGLPPYTTDSRITSDSSSITINFNYDIYNYAYPQYATKYRYDISGGVLTSSEDFIANPYTITNLAPYTDYDIVLYSYNDNWPNGGYSGGSTTHKKRTMGRPDNAPNLSLFSKTNISATFNFSGNGGGTPPASSYSLVVYTITGYVSSPYPSVLYDNISTLYSQITVDLSSNYTYHVYLYSKNILWQTQKNDGWNTPAGPVVITTFGTLSSPPTDLISSSITSYGFDVSWNAPTDGIPSNVQTYRVTLFTGGTQTLDVSGITVNYYNFSELPLPFTDYTVNVYAYNSVWYPDVYSPSSSITVKTLASPSSPPTDVRADPISGTSNIQVTYVKPSYEGVPAASYYYKLNNSEHYVSIEIYAPNDTISFDISSNVNAGEPNTVTIYAYNINWPTPYVNSSSVSVTPYKTGSAPLAVRAVPISGTSDVRVSYVKPSYEGFPTADYYFTVDNDEEESMEFYVLANGNPFDILEESDLSIYPGKESKVIVAAHNVNWPTPYVDSSSVSVTPYKTGSAPIINPSSSTSDSSITINFTESTGGTPPATKYKVTYNEIYNSGVDIEITNAPFTTFTITPLEPYKEYNIVLQAYNVNWPSTDHYSIESNPINITTLSRSSSPPTDVRAVPITRTSNIRVTYTIPSYTGAPEVSDYYYKLKNNTYYLIQDQRSNGDSRTFDISSSNVNAGETNTVIVAAYNVNWPIPHIDSESYVHVTTYKTGSAPLYTIQNIYKDKIDVSFASSDGYPLPTNYYYSINDASKIAVGYTTSPITILNLIPGTSYNDNINNKIKLYAYNGFWPGSYSPPADISATTLPVNIPSSFYSNASVDIASDSLTTPTLFNATNNFPNTYYLTNNADDLSQNMLYMYGSSNGFKIKGLNSFQNGPINRAKELGPYNMSPWYLSAAIVNSINVLQTGKWIWNDANAATSAKPNEIIWFYYTFYYNGLANNGKLYSACDDYGTFYLNSSVGITIDGGWPYRGYQGEQALYSSIAINNGFNYIRVCCVNGGGSNNSAGLFISIADNSGNVIAVTNSDWVCTLSNTNTYNSGAESFNNPLLYGDSTFEYNYGGTTPQFPLIPGYNVLYITGGTGSVVFENVTIYSIFLVGGGAGGHANKALNINTDNTYPGLGGKIVNISDTQTIYGPTEFNIVIGVGGVGGVGVEVTDTKGTDTTISYSNNNYNYNYTASGGIVATGSDISISSSISYNTNTNATLYNHNNLYYGGPGGIRFGKTVDATNTPLGTGNTNTPLGGGGGAGGYSMNVSGGKGGGISNNLSGGNSGSSIGDSGSNSTYGGGGGCGGGSGSGGDLLINAGKGGSGLSSEGSGDGVSGFIRANGGGGGGGKNTGGGGGTGGNGGYGGSGIAIIVYKMNG